MESNRGSGVQVLVLGPVGVRRDGAEADLGPRLQRLLAALTAADGGVVPVDRLVDVVWSGEPPKSAERTLRTYVTRLRRILGGDREDRIVFQQPGYRLRLDPGEIDSGVFEAELDGAVSHLRAADAPAAVALLASAIGRWRGEAYAGFGDEEWARPEVVRLQERLVEARCALIEARLAAGVDERAVADAQALVEAEPLRDRPRALLMRALYASGRQADALRVFGAYRRFLADETGLDPGEELTELEGRIARGDVNVGEGGQPLRGYQLAERIGEGAFSVVHRGVQPGLDRDVAVKIIRAELADRPEFIRRFEVEARTVARLEHPNVVPLYDFWREPGAAYLVMRLLRGGSVEQAIRARGPFSREQTVRLLDDVGEALTTAHRAGVVHRDVRPANLLLDERGTAYLTDFGIALPAATADAGPILSPAYAAPEVLRGEPAAASADVLSLGVTVFEVLTGRLPFADSADRAEVIRRQLSEPLPPVRATRTDLPPEVDEVLARATAKAPDDRHATVAAFVDDMTAALSVDGRAAGTRPHPARSAPPDNPYRGLHAFDEPDADRFFGREALVTELAETLDRVPMVVAVGPSGSGKSSVVRAGLLPAIRRGAVPGSDRWFVTTMVPGSDPIAALEIALLRIAVNPPASLREQLAEPGGLLRAVRRVLPDDGATVLLVVDQFEELFTQVADLDERRRFLSELAAAITHPGSPLRVAATLRADHYDAPLRHPEMAALVTDGTVTVRPMSPDELERAITLPARAVGVEAEPALVAELVAGISARPTALPLLQFALTELFDRRVADVMLLSTHHELGGLTGALTARAERIVEGAGPDDEAEIRRIFGRLVTLGEGVEDTRRRALRSEVGDGERTAWLLDAFVNARLLTTGRDPRTREPVVEIAHEALLRDWPRLRGWLDDDRADLRTLHAVTAATGAWTIAGRDDGELARGGRLEAVVDLATRHPEWLNADESAWVSGSVDAAGRAAAAEAAAVERDRRQNRRLRTLLAATGVLLVVALVAAAVALVLRQRSLDSERRAEAARDVALDAETSAETAREDAEAARDVALDAETSAEMAREDAEIERLIALSAAQLEADPARSILLALEANRRRDDVDTQTAVHRAIATDPRRIAIFPRRLGEDAITVFSDDGAVGLALSVGGSAEWFDPMTGATLASHQTDAEIVEATLSGDGSVAAFATLEQVVEVVDADAAGRTLRLPVDDRAEFPHLDAEGAVLAFGVGGETHFVDAETGEEIARYRNDKLSGETRLVAGGEVAYVSWVDPSPLGPPRGVDVVDVESGERIERITSPTELGLPTSFDVAEDGTLVVGYADGLVRVHSPEQDPVDLRGHSAEIFRLRVSGDRIITAGADDEVRIWSLTGRVVAPPLATPGQIDALATDRDGRVIVSFTGRGHFVADLAGGVLVEQQWPVARSQVFPDHGYYDTPGADDRSIDLRRLDDNELVRRIDVTDMFDSPLGGQPFYSPDGEWMMIYESAGPEFAVVEIRGDRRHVLDVEELYEDVTGSEPGNENLVVRPSAGGTGLFFASAGADGRRHAAWIDTATGEIIDGPVEVPVVGPAWLLDDGRVVMGSRGEELVILAAELDDGHTIVDGSSGFVPYHHDERTGRVLVAGQDGAVALLDPTNATLRLLEPATGLVYGAAFSPDGNRLAVTTLTDGVQLYDVDSGRRLGVPTGLDTAGVDAGNGLRWTENGRGFWTAPTGGPILLSADPDRWREIACGIVNRELTAEEWSTFVGDSVPQQPACP